jgi:hypothetical protein
MTVIVPENLAADIRIVTLRMICLAGPFFRGEHTSVKNDARKLRKLALIRLDEIEAHTEAFSTDPLCNSRAAVEGERNGRRFDQSGAPVRVSLRISSQFCRPGAESEARGVLNARRALDQQSGISGEKAPSPKSTRLGLSQDGV